MSGRMLRPDDPSERAVAHDVNFTLAIVGEAGVGKTSLLQRLRAQVNAPSRYAEGQPISCVHQSTLGADYIALTMPLELPSGRQVRVRLQMRDTAGTERFAPMIKGYMRNNHAILYAFDVNDARAIEQLVQRWAPFVDNAVAHEDARGMADWEDLQQERARANSDLVGALGPTRLLVATKVDMLGGGVARVHTLADYQESRRSTLQRLQERCCPSPSRDLEDVAWTSARDGTNVIRTFRNLCLHLLWRFTPPNIERNNLVAVSRYAHREKASGKSPEGKQEQTKALQRTRAHRDDGRARKERLSELAQGLGSTPKSKANIGAQGNSGCCT